MAPKATREQVRTDLVRLLRGVDLYRDWRMAMWQRAHGPDARPDRNEFVEPGATTLARFDAYDGPQYAQFLADVRTWYAVTAGELTWLLKNGDPAVAAQVETFLADFAAGTGFAFFTESGQLEKIAARVLKRGRIAGTDEWYLVKDLLDDTDQTIVAAEARATLARLSHLYEAAR